MSGRFWKWIHLVGIFVALAVWGAAMYFRWLESVAFVSHISMAALVLAEISSWQGSRTEQKQDKQMEDTEDDVEEHREVTE